MCEEAPVVQMSIDLGVGLVRRFCKRKPEQPGFAIREGKLSCIKQRLIRSIRCNGPLQRLESLKPLVGHACEQGRQRSDLTINFGRMLILPRSPATIADVLDDSPPVPSPSQPSQHL